jgi:hypothetical protein
LAGSALDANHAKKHGGIARRWGWRLPSLRELKDFAWRRAVWQAHRNGLNQVLFAWDEIQQGFTSTITCAFMAQSISVHSTHP